MHHVFVSYSRSDREWVRSLVKRLEQQRLKIWIDQKDIPVTVPWADEVRDAIEEAALFLCCASPAFRRSANCATEVGLAVQAAKPQLVVAVGDDLDACAGRITQTLREINPVRGRRTELRVLARDWDRAGRPRNRLAGGRSRNRLETALALPPPASEAEQSFLQASKSRTRRLAGITTLLVTLIAASSITTVVLRAEQDAINSVNSQVATTESQEQDSLNQISQDPYRGLQLAAEDGGNESEANANIIATALADPTPDDAFSVPQATRFAVRPVGAEVIVVTASGQEWQHAADSAGTGQAAVPLRQAVAPEPALTPDGLSASRDPASGQVEVFQHGQLWRTIDFDAVPGALAFSPDGRFLAAAVGQQVEVADIGSAQVRIHLRGATGDLLDVTWSADGTHVWALDDSRIFSWSTGAARALVDNPSADYNSVLPSASPGAVWIVGAHALTQIDVTTGAVLASITIDDTLGSAGAPPDGSLALVSGDRYLWVVPLSRIGDAGRPRHITLPGCDLGRPTFASDTTAYVPCIGGSLLKLSVSSAKSGPSAKVVSVITVSSFGVFGATAVPGTDTVYAGDKAGYLFVGQGESWTTEIQASECDMEVERIAVAPGDQAILPIGSGSGEGTCTKIGLRAPGDDPASPGSWTWNAVIDAQELSIYGSAVAFSPHGGSFAIGYSNGTITMYPTDNLAPDLVDNTADGMVRDMLTLPNGYLIAVTNTGMVQRLRLCDTCISNAALAKVAASRLQLAVRLGLAGRINTSKES